MEIRTLDFGIVPVRKNKKYTKGKILATIDLSNEGFASIRSDLVTGQPFAVLLDENLKEI